MKRISNLFSSKIDENKHKIFRDRLINYSIVVVSGTLTSVAVFGDYQPSEWVAGEFLTASILGLISMFVCQERELNESLHRRRLELNKKHALRGENIIAAIEAEAQENNALKLRAKQLKGEVGDPQNPLSLELLPPAVQFQLAQQRGIPIGFFSEFFDQPNNDPPDSIESVNYDARKIESEIQYIREKTGINLEWLNLDFICSSKLVAGKKGSGKSVFMRYEAAKWFIYAAKNFPKFRLYILDPHYDIEDSKTHWLVGLDQNHVAKAYIFKDVEDHYNKWLEIYDELENRVKGLSKDRYPIKILCDEIERYKRNLDSTKYNFIIKTIEFIQDEGRKYNIEITLGAKTLKKERIGLDSSILTQMNWILFQTVVYDKTIVFPENINSKEIREEVEKLITVQPNIPCRVVIVIKQEEDDPKPYVGYLPLLKPPYIKVENNQFVDESISLTEDYDNNDDEEDEDDENKNPWLNIKKSPEEENYNIYQYLQKWIEECLEINKIPSKKHLKFVWEQLTKRELNEAGLEQLLELINYYKYLEIWKKNNSI